MTLYGSIRGSSTIPTFTLQKRYAYLQWSQGAGKTVSGTAQGMYRLAHGQTDYVFVVSSAISIETTWAPFLAKYQIPHKVIRSRKDLRRVYPGGFVLITLGRVKNYQRQIQKIVKLANRKQFLIYDEAQNSSALEANEEVGRLTKATIACFHSLRYKLLMSGTSINNNVVESYAQLYLEDYDNSILICTQQSLSESISIDSVDYCFIAELHWNESRMSKFYYRFIRYTSTRDKFVYYVNYPESIETNLIYLLVSKGGCCGSSKGRKFPLKSCLPRWGLTCPTTAGPFSVGMIPRGGQNFIGASNRSRRDFFQTKKLIGEKPIGFFNDYFRGMVIHNYLKSNNLLNLNKSQIKGILG